MGLNYRCTKDGCRKRVTLKQPIDWYVKRPLCPECGRDTLKPVYRKERERSKRRGCFCRGNDWPHNRGAIVDEYRTCIYADPQKVADADFNDGLGVYQSDDVTGHECPF